MRKIAAVTSPGIQRRAYRTVTIDQVIAGWVPDINFIVPICDEADASQIEQLAARGINNLAWIKASEIELGDIIFPVPEKGIVDVSYRCSDTHHTLFVTNRCNSNCLMCSQPPTKEEDGWLVDEAIEVVRHIEHSPQNIGITGGEPLLLNARLRDLLNEIERRHPATQIDLLTNGRRLSEQRVVGNILDGLTANVAWLVPLYGHAHMLHDFVVQSPGAFEETLEGLLRLQQYGQQIQLRAVLIEPVLEHLDDLCEFIGRNLPFVHEVALMACEPIGFALANKEICDLDLKDWWSQLTGASRILRRYGVRHLIMNAPLCALPESLWPIASRSISDWKQVYAGECEGCELKSSCSGLFAWHERGWMPTRIMKIKRSVE
ncbi:His-Xaa-Ser system radical SAM maturase HxsC [Duganella qianjiadongensis]|uniref:His-Xaa-Ser system radical SAM maturase HxsC n=1 Tax=Duganella qianjiadongensis TaxID=2692176 RepID=A0ABW9VRQ6_9BURK|nr:His-Xaa-Ser system radical SAM maturase HxsC [Duganella qianjiadongensis]MYM41350.1 His-Xaa-Ser system radical SAM maturase HxsC [Duganella qianjiadongensis]